MIENKELSPLPQKETIKPEGMVDIQSREKLTVPKEVESWMEKLEKDPQIAPKNRN